MWLKFDSSFSKLISRIPDSLWPGTRQKGHLHAPKRSFVCIFICILYCKVVPSIIYTCSRIVTKTIATRWWTRGFDAAIIVDQQWSKSLWRITSVLCLLFAQLWPIFNSESEVTVVIVMVSPSWFVKNISSKRSLEPCLRVFYFATGTELLYWGSIRCWA